MSTVVLSLGLLGLSLLIDLVGFRRFVHFISVGYAFSIAAMCVAVVVLFPARIDLFLALQLAGLTLWGLRLGVFVLKREQRSSYQKESAGIQEQYGGGRLPLKLVIWLAVSVLYVVMFTPVVFHVTGGRQFSGMPANLVELAGGAVLLGGLALEIVADRQKSAYKASFPRRFCDVGLYRWVRCPNYLGEILIWLGSWSMGIPYYATPWQWAASLAGLAGLVWIMYGSAKRLEAEQARRYGEMPEYQAYRSGVALIFPRPLVHTWLPESQN
jgi:steroid 5-alpha reductase family enzyme